MLRSVRSSVLPAAQRCALGDLGSPRSRELLDDPDPEVVEDAVKSLASIGYEDAKYRLAGLVDPWNPKLTGAIGEAMRDFGDLPGMERAIEALVPALEHENPEVRQRAVKEIGKIGGPSALPYLEAALEDEDYGVKSEARKRIAKL